MTRGQACKRAIAGLFMVAAGMATAHAEKYNPLPVALFDEVPNAGRYCINADTAEFPTKYTDHLHALRDMAQDRTAMGRFLIGHMEEDGFPVCMKDDAAFAATSMARHTRNGMLYYATISFNERAFPDFAVHESLVEEIQAFALLEEYAHGVNNKALYDKRGLNPDNMVQFSAADAVKLSFYNEAFASSAAVVAARQQHENGNSSIWHAISKSTGYANIVRAVNEAAEQNIEALSNGKALIAGVKGWLASPALKEMVAERIIFQYARQFRTPDYTDQIGRQRAFGFAEIKVIAAAHGAGDNVDAISENDPVASLSAQTLDTLDKLDKGAARIAMVRRNSGHRPD